MERRMDILNEITHIIYETRYWDSFQQTTLAIAESNNKEKLIEKIFETPELLYSMVGDNTKFIVPLAFEFGDDHNHFHFPTDLSTMNLLIDGLKYISPIMKSVNGMSFGSYYIHSLYRLFAAKSVVCAMYCVVF